MKSRASTPVIGFPEKATSPADKENQGTPNARRSTPLLQKRADPDVRDSRGLAALHLACARGQMVDRHSRLCEGPSPERCADCIGAQLRTPSRLANSTPRPSTTSRLLPKSTPRRIVMPATRKIVTPTTRKQKNILVVTKKADLRSRELSCDWRY